MMAIAVQQTAFCRINPCEENIMPNETGAIIKLLGTWALAATLSNAATGSTLTVTELAANDLLITEYMADPVGVSDADGEYFELFNASGFPVDLSGLTIRDDGSNSFTVTDLLIEADAFAVFSSSAGTALGITPDYVYGSSMSLTNTDDEIALYRPDDSLIHKALYSDGDFFGDGVAHELAVAARGTPLVVGPTGGADFVASTTPMPLGNFGSPGFAGNTHLPLLPIPGAVWLFGSALGFLAAIRRHVSRGHGHASDLLW
jgi:hypothetical protein